MTDIQELVKAGMAEIAASVIIRGGRLVNVNSEEIYEADVAIYRDRIVAIGDVHEYAGADTTIIDAEGRYLTPGLIDGHLHIECSKLSITSFANAVIPHGTTSIVSGLDQILVVAGLEGVREFLDESKMTPVKIFWGAPCKTPYTLPTSTVGYYFTPEDHIIAQKWPECVGVWETVREFIQENDEHVFGALRIANDNRLPIFGCAPMAKGKKLNSYLCAGIRLDHESYDSDEALEKVRNGMYLLIRESTVAHFLVENIKVITEQNPSISRRVSFCTDDVTASDIMQRGHMDNLIRMAIAEGIDPIKAIQMGTINSAEAYRIDHLVGSISPGRIADILFVDDLNHFGIDKVITNGQLVVEHGKVLEEVKAPTRSKALLNSMNVAEVVASDFDFRIETDSESVKVLSMAVSEEVPFVRKRRDVVLGVEDSIVKPDVDQDALYVTVVERYGKTDNKPVAFCSGWKLKSGAMASSAAPDDNNIICIGTNTNDMAIAINHLIRAGGGQVVVNDGEVTEFLSLPIGGIVADLAPEEMAARETKLDNAARELGCELPAPFMYMFFLPITAIPDYAITDIGAIDCIALQKFDPVLEEL